MSNFTAASKQKRFQGTYRVVPRIEWTLLLCKEFGSPDWAALYPVKESSGAFDPLNEKTVHSELAARGQLLSPRMACKLFHDGLLLIKKGEETPKFIQDRIPEIAHKCFKKKQWRKQFYEAMRRVCCRLVVGLGFRPNCLAEDAFIHAVLGMAFELGWQRIAEHTAGLPEYVGDRDFSKVLKFAANEDVGNLLKGIEPAAKRGANAGAVDVSKTDVKTGWFKCYDTSTSHLFDHIVAIHDDETDDWSATTGDSSMGSLGSLGDCRVRSGSMLSDVSADDVASSLASASLDSGDEGTGGLPPASPVGRKLGKKGRGGAGAGAAPLEPTAEHSVYHEGGLEGADKGSRVDLVSLASAPASVAGRAGGRQ